MLDPVGFWSYARQDDENSDGHLSQLRALVGKAIVLQSGVKTALWQDVAAIPYGADWAATIEHTIGRTSFFIPIVTPSFLKSSNCRDEFVSFRRRMRELGRDDLIFPVHYVSVDHLATSETAFGDEFTALQRSQWIDFRPLIFAEANSSELRRRAADLAASILNALQQPTPAEIRDPPRGTSERPQVADQGDHSATTKLPLALSDSQVRVLKELISRSNFASRTLGGVAKDSGLPVNQVRVILGELIGMDLVLEWKKEGKLLYKLTARGAAALARAEAHRSES
jgi:hypothetical protein